MTQKFKITVVRTRKLIDRTLVEIAAESPEMAAALLRKQLDAAVNGDVDSVGQWHDVQTVEVDTRLFVADETGMVCGLDDAMLRKAKAALAADSGDERALSPLSVLMGLDPEHQAKLRAWQKKLAEGLGVTTPTDIRVDVADAGPDATASKPSQP